MPLNKPQLKSTIVQIMTEMLTREDNSIDEYAERLSNAIDTYVKTAKITYIAGLTSPSGPVTGTFNGNLE